MFAPASPPSLQVGGEETVAGCRLPVGDGARASLLPLPRRTIPDEPPSRPFSIFRRPIPVYPGLSRSIPVYPGLSRLFRSILVYSGLSRFIPVYSGPSRPVPVAAGRNRAHSVERRPSTPFGPRSPPRRGQWRTCLNRYRIFPIPSTPAVSDAGAAVARRHRHRRAGARGRRFLPSPLSSSPPPFQGGGWEGGPAPGSAGVPPASREARTRVRAFGPPCRRDAGASGQFTDERGREAPRPGRRAPGVNPPPDLPPSRGEERRRRGPPPCSAIESGPQRGTLTPPPVQGRRSEDGVSSAITLGEAGRAGRSHLEISRWLADVAIAGQARAAAVFSPPPFFFLSPLSGGRLGGGSRPWERRRPAGLARSANEGAGLRPAMPAGRRRSQAVHG